MYQDELKTFYADPYKVSKTEAFEQNSLLNSQGILTKLIDSCPFFMLVLNKQRQIVAANSTALSSFKSKRLDEIIGLKVGEAIGCIRKDEYPSGCGTTKFCRDCGAASAIMQSQNSRLLL